MEKSRLDNGLETYRESRLRSPGRSRVPRSASAPRPSPPSLAGAGLPPALSLPSSPLSQSLEPPGLSCLLSVYIPTLLYPPPSRPAVGGPRGAGVPHSLGPPLHPLLTDRYVSGFPPRHEGTRHSWRVGGVGGTSVRVGGLCCFPGLGWGLPGVWTRSDAFFDVSAYGWVGGGAVRGRGQILVAWTGQEELALQRGGHWDEDGCVKPRHFARWWRLWPSSQLLEPLSLEWAHNPVLVIIAQF